MSITTKAFKLSKQIKFCHAKGELLHAFHRNHAYMELLYDGKKEKSFSHYRCFDKFEADLGKWLDKNCTGLWSSEGETSPLTAGKPTQKHYNGNFKTDPDGAVLKLHLYFEQPDDLALYLKQKGILLKLQAE
jgi:hypothetical protein